MTMSRIEKLSATSTLEPLLDYDTVPADVAMDVAMSYEDQLRKIRNLVDLNRDSGTIPIEEMDKVIGE